MRILSVAFALAAVGDHALGGAEQVLSQIDRALVASGHQSRVVGAAGSRVSGTLFATTPGPQPSEPDYYPYRYFEHQRKIREALSSGAVDLVHMHGCDFHEFLPETSIPVLATLHMPPNWYPPWIYSCERPLFYLNCVSASQRSVAPNCPLIVSTIQNGVAIPALAPLPVSQRRGAVIVSRICPEKGIHIGIAAARKARVSLTIAGGAFGYPDHLDYFHHQVLPAVDGFVTLVGAVGYRQKQELLRSAKCLLVPSLAPETSSLVSMEALACGTPVIAMRSGALPEIIEHGKTGFLANSADEMAEAMGWVEQLDPATCRRTALERFSADRMTREYLELYERIIARAEPHEAAVLGKAGS